MEEQNNYQSNYQNSYQNSYQNNYQNNYQNSYQNNYQGNYQNTNPNVEPKIPEEYKPLSPWAYFGYNLLFMIPIVGIIMIFIFAFNNKNINRRNYARSFFCSFLIGAIAGIVGIIITISLSAIVMNSSDTINSASYAGFAQEFGEYSESVTIGHATLRADTGVKGQILSRVQSIFMIANGFEEKDDNAGIEMKLPAGYVLPDAIQYALYGGKNDDVVAYLIDDKNIEYYEEDEKFYGDSNGKEYHLITSDGYVFTIPGFPRKQDDGSIEYVITSSGKSYVVKDYPNFENEVPEPITDEYFDEIYGIDLNDKTVKSSPIYKKGLERK